MVDGLTGRPFSAETLIPPKILSKSNKDKIVRRSREEYCVEKQLIEEKIQRWSGLSNKEQEESVLFNTTCSVCGKDTKVSFRPDGVRPIYCKDCFKKVKAREQIIKKDDDKEIIPKEKVVQEEEKKVSSEEVKEKPPVLEKQKTHPKRAVDVSELKKVLDKALEKSKENKD